MDEANQMPKTPQRGRNIYPTHLAKSDENRVPLHRRGTSRQYERLEDLLREAGFKETRVFTPETERVEAEAEERRQREDAKRVRAYGASKGMGAMVNFFTGLIPWNENSAVAETATKTQSLGRAAGKEAAKANATLGNDLWDSPTPPTKTLRQPLTPVFLTTDFSSPGSSNATSSSSSISPPQRVRRVVDARSTLRHMISAPDIPKRPHPPPQARRTSELPRSSKSSQHLQPPLPTNWLNTVAQAVMGTGPGSGAYVGGPVSRGRAARSGSVLAPPAEGSPLDKSASSSTTRRLFTPHTSCASTTLGMITPALVVCRSAPGSRSSSVVRTARKGKDSHGGCRVPSLGVTTIEGEMWPDSIGPLFGQTTASTSTSARTIHLDSEMDDEESDVDGEPDFARLLVPARRQHSIHSLRKHLHDASPSARPGALANTTAGATVRRPGTAPGSGRASATSSVRRVLRTADSYMDYSADPDDSFEVGLARDLQRSRRGSIDEGEDGLSDWATHGLPGLAEGPPSRRRGAVPVSWASWAQRS